MELKADDVGKVLMPAGTTDALKQESISPSMLAEEKQSRSIGLVSTVAGSGDCISKILIIKDRNFKQFQHVVVMYLLLAWPNP